MVDLVGSVAASEKFVFFSHPADVVLLIIDKTQCPGCRHFNIIVSIQGVMMEAINLRRLLDMQKRCCSWSSSLYTKPSCE
jgi:hypothetical protein